MKILELEIRNIRGIKYITISPEGKNVVVFGPNGVGKSAIVDAIDFLLTDRISRLAGEGTKCLSLKEHGCHVDSREELENTVVVAKVEVDGKEIMVERSIHKPSSLKVEPKEHKALINSYLKIAALGQHILSRREVLKYITAEAGKRAKEIQSLLNLMDIENLRQNFVSIKNDAVAKFKNAESSLDIAKSEISNLLSLGKFSVEISLDKVNKLRGILGGSKITEVSMRKIKEGIMPYPFGERKEILTKEEIKNNLKEIRSLLQEKEEIINKEYELKNLLEEIKKEAKLKQYSLYKRLFEAGISIVDESNVCPLCGREWEEGDFRAYLEKRKKETEIAKEKQVKIDEISFHIKGKIDLLKNDITNLEKAHKQFDLKIISKEELRDHLSLLDSWSDTMLKPLEVFEDSKWPTSELKDIFDTTFLETKIFTPLEDALEKFGEQFSKRQQAWDTLTTLEERWRRYQHVWERKKVIELFKRRAEASLDYFEKARDSVLESIYADVRNNFDEYYKTIHSDDETSFVSNISHVKAELNFEVDFYGRGMFPPHALHSEGHQDSMGICLFFALNKYLTKDSIRIIVLDDVIMSIDLNHRRAICHLLNESFPDKQFIITTHSADWAKQLKTEGVVTQKNMIHFVNWNINTGPVFELDKDLWDRIREDLDKDDIPSASHKLRRDAECFFENVCDFLGATVPYKGHHQWELGDFAPAAISAFKHYLKKAKVKFQEMGEQDKVNELNKLDERAGQIIATSQVEQWVINANVHYNRWGEFSKQDFEPVVEAFKELFDLFTCSSCGSLISVSQDKGNSGKTAVSCNCGKIFWPIQ